MVDSSTSMPGCPHRNPSQTLSMLPMTPTGRSTTRVGRVRHVLCQLFPGHRDRDVHDLVLRPGAGAHRRALRRRQPQGNVRLSEYRCDFHGVLGSIYVCRRETATFPPNKSCRPPGGCVIQLFAFWGGGCFVRAPAIARDLRFALVSRRSWLLCLFEKERRERRPLPFLRLGEGWRYVLCSGGSLLAGVGSEKSLVTLRRAWYMRTGVFFLWVFPSCPLPLTPTRHLSHAMQKPAL